MTAGFGAQDGRPEGAAPHDMSGAGAGRPGPLPPRIEPHPPAGASWPAAQTGGTVHPQAVPAPRTGWAPPPNAAQWSAAPQANPPAAPRGPAPLPYGTATPQGGPPPTPYGSTPGGPYAPPSPAQPGRRRLPMVLATALVVLLAAVTGVQAYQLDRLGDRLAATDKRLAQGQEGDALRLDGLETRADELEKQAGAAFNPEAVASAVLPSVFRVRAGQFTGSAFAVGKPTSDGGTNLFTNFHVVEAVWEGGGRQVFLERTDQRFPATIVKVDKTNDVAHLRTTNKFTGLVTAPTAVKSGQQIIVVGAPLGLEDSVTTGVVSALRSAQGSSGPTIQFDAPINPGNSGGPVINGSKQVVGIATAKARDAEGIGLAVPIKVACDGFKIC
ncbi:trypsin-like peptidase domain-containing protein [Micromonospora profundi]|uniref:trypsin-like peptidase domain-containing protein n=1 Tax=Micromonospora profundi TaxID=1420889 RepID=UPI0035E4053A